MRSVLQMVALPGRVAIQNAAENHHPQNAPRKRQPITASLAIMTVLVVGLRESTVPLSRQNI